MGHSVCVSKACPQHYWYHKYRLRRKNRKVTVSSSSGGEQSATGTPSTNARPEQVLVSLPRLRGITTQALRDLGYSPEETNTLSDVLMYAELRGNNQGLIKLASGAMKPPIGRQPPVVDFETPVSALLDARQEYGALVMLQATNLALQKARSSSIGLVGTVNTSSGTGAIGYFAQKVAEEGYVAIAMSQSPELVAPHGAADPIFGTNPFAIAVPTLHQPVVLDMTTAAVTLRGVQEAHMAGQSIPLGLAIDQSGADTTDPAEALLGALLPFDGSFKGSHLCLMVELLAGALVGAATQDKKASKDWGNLIVALDPNLFGRGEDFPNRVQQVLDRVKGARKRDGVEEIFLPGERGTREMEDNLVANQLWIEANLFSALEKLVDKPQ